MSAASSACDHIYNWINGTPKDTWVSMGVYSDGSYNAPKVQKLLAPLKGLLSCLLYKVQEGNEARGAAALLIEAA